MTDAPSLSSALGIGRGDLVAFTGGGGKTAAVLRAARELAEAGWRVLASTTTRVGPTMSSEMPVVTSGPALEARLRSALGTRGLAFLAAGRAADGKFDGVPAETLDALAASGVADVILVEADGSRQRPLKAPAPHEPVVPASASIVSFVMGIDALGASVDGPLVHRPEALVACAAADGIACGPTVTAALMAAVAVSPLGGLKGLPPGAAARPIVNKARGALRDGALAVAAAIAGPGRPPVDRVVVTDIRSGAFAVVRPRG